MVKKLAGKQLEKMSPTELLAYAQNLVKQKIVEKPKPKVEKVPITQKLSKILSNSGKVITYPKKMVSIAKMREEELDKTTAPGKLKMTFGELFEKRLNSMSGKKTTIQVTVHAEVRYSYGITSELESKSWKINDPIKIPRLSSSDMYKLFIYLLLKQGFSILSTQTIEEVGADIITHKKSFFKKHKMGRFKLESYFLDNKKRFKLKTSETCVIDYIWSQIRGKPGIKTYDYDKLYEELVDYAEMPLYVDTTEEVISWIKNCHSNISLHAYTCTYRQFTDYISHAPDIVLCFMVKDHHLHPITDPDKNRCGHVS